MESFEVRKTEGGEEECVPMFAAKCSPTECFYGGEGFWAVRCRYDGRLLVNVRGISWIDAVIFDEVGTMNEEV
jgi:hypothetical protein